MDDATPPGRQIFQRDVPKGMKTWCHDCEGKGAKWQPRMATLQAEPAYAAQMQACRSCDGTGRLDGFQPPC